MGLASLIETAVRQVSVAEIEHPPVGSRRYRAVTDGKDIPASVQDRISLVFFIRPFEFAGTGDCDCIIAARTATAVDGIDQVIIAVFLEPLLSFHAPSLVVTKQAERFTR